jgi:peptidoglycan L-alanyl-D-glutamate endopeptidase CwlK
MPKYSKKSKERLATCHPLLQELFNEVIKHVDCTIIEGVRTLETQEEYVRRGVSKTMKSKHLKQEDGYSWAVDCLSYPIDWNDWHRNYMFAGYVRGVANSLGIKIRSGGDWNGNFQVKDQRFHDLPHFELLSDKREGGTKAPVQSGPLLPDISSEDDINDMLDQIDKDMGL